jgi:hypothetical protein
MLSLTECKKKLNKNGVQFSDEEVELIRNVLYKLAEVCHKKINDEKNEKENNKGNNNTGINGKT